MECPFCNKDFKTRFFLIRHLKNKYKCKSTYSNENYNDLICQLENFKYLRNIVPVKPLASEEPFFQLKCPDCETIFTNKKSIYYHRKYVCNQSIVPIKTPLTKDISTIDINSSNLDIIHDVSKLIQGSSAPVTINFVNPVFNNYTNSTINSNISNTNSDNSDHSSHNNTQNIQINDYGKENLSYLQYSDIIEAGPWQTVPRLFEKIHFNPDHKENYNIKIKPTEKSKFIDILFQGKWVKRLKYDELSEKEEKLRYFIIDFAKENHTEIPNHILKRISEYEEKMEHMDKTSKEYQYILSKLEEIGMKGYVVMEADLNDL